MGPARHADGAVLGLLRLMEKRMIRAAKLSGKGWGVIATRDIPVGTLVSICSDDTPVSYRFA